MNDNYIEKASAYCKESGIEYHITESNGTPGRGKNSLLEKFLESDNDYCVQIDGDDYLTPHGVYMYDSVAKTNNPPDAICLTHQVAIDYDSEDIKEYLKNNGVIPKRSDITAKPGYSCRVDYDEMLYNINNVKRLVGEARDDFIKTMTYFYNTQRKYSEKSETNCRITWYSRKAAQHRFLEDIYIGEDTLHYFKLKNEHVEGRLTFMNNVEMPPTYIYDQCAPEGGTVFRHSKDYTDISWVKTYLAKAREYEEQGILHDNESHELPLLKVDYPADYIPDDYGIDRNGTFRFSDRKGRSLEIRYPANATEESLLAKFQA